MLVIIGCAMVLVTAIIVKLFDSKIRKHQWSKAAVNVSMISGFVMFIVGLIQLIF